MLSVPHGQTDGLGCAFTTFTLFSIPFLSFPRKLKVKEEEEGLAFKVLT
jgi:hypothetical protein